MDGEDVMDWVAWATIFFLFVACVFVAVWLLAVIIAEVVCLIQRHRNNGKSPHDMLMEKPLQPKDEEGNKDDECVICLMAAHAEEEHGGGERCRWSVLPGCSHAFHKECVLKWLRNRSTCPLCRSDVLAAARHDHEPTINNADNMV